MEVNTMHALIILITNFQTSYTPDNINEVRPVFQ